MAVITVTPKRITSSTLIYTGECYLFSILIGTDGTHDPVIAVHDDTDGDDATKEIVPSITYDASALGMNGVVFKFPKFCSNGLYVKISNLGTGSVIVDYRSADSVSINEIA